MGQEPGRKSSRTMRSEAASQQAGRPESQRRGGVAGPRGGSGGRFLAVFLVVIVLLVVVCASLYMVKESARRRREEVDWRRKVKKDETSLRAYGCFVKAYSTGLSFVTGRKTDMTDDQLFAPFRGDEKVYNVVYTRNFRDQRGRSTFDQRILDKSRTNIQESGTTVSREAVLMKAGKLSDDTPIMTARRTYAPEPGNTTSEGGEILVIVYAVK